MMWPLTVTCPARMSSSHARREATSASARTFCKRGPRVASVKGWLGAALVRRRDLRAVVVRAPVGRWGRARLDRVEAGEGRDLAMETYRMHRRDRVGYVRHLSDDKKRVYVSRWLMSDD